MDYSLHWLSSLDPRLPKYKAVYKVISSAIASGHLQVGDKLPPRRVLAQKLSVTIDTISKAFSLLTQHNLVTSRIGDGTYIRERNEFAKQEDNIDLSQNHPCILYEDFLLADSLKQISKNRSKLADLLDYQDDTGYKPHQIGLSNYLKSLGIANISPDQLTITNGGQHSLYLTLRALLPLGSSLMAEQYTYPVLPVMAREMRLQMLPVPIDEEGLIARQLENVQQSTGSKVLYCQPTCHNPTTATLSQERRRAIADLARRNNLLIIENITQAMFMKSQPTTLFELAPEHTVLIGSFSKLTSPGLRFGFVAAEKKRGSRIAAWLRLICWMPCLLSAEVMIRWIESGELKKLLEAKREDLKNRHKLVEKHLSSFSCRSNPETNYIWLHLPEPWEAQTLTSALLNEHLAIRSAQAFTFGRTKVPKALRLSLGTSPTLQDLDFALGRLARILKQSP
jgi:DNA-binding transcriptional MocR family regulator